MRSAIVDWTLCQGCDLCEPKNVCKTKAFVKMVEEDCYYIDQDRCRACGDCVLVCSYLAISLFDPGKSKY